MSESTQAERNELRRGIEHSPDDPVLRMVNDADSFARLTPIRQALWDNGEITIAGLARLDRALGIQTYNQCDGCARGLPLDEHGIHWGEGYDMIGCTADRYGTQAPDSPE